MGMTLRDIAEELKRSPNKVQLIYAFNGSGKTRLSREFKQLFFVAADTEEGGDVAELLVPSLKKIIYYNAFTEDLFY